MGRAFSPRPWVWWQPGAAPQAVMERPLALRGCKELASRLRRSSFAAATSFRLRPLTQGLFVAAVEVDEVGGGGVVGCGWWVGGGFEFVEDFCGEDFA